MTATIGPHALEQKLIAAWPAERWRDLTVLVAVSGGADSVALVRALVSLRQRGEGRLVLAHYNHGQRGAEADADQAFVEELGRGLRLEVVVGKRGRVGEGASERGGERKNGCSEESLRLLRYEFLSSAAEQVGARYVAIAHTADDQVETVLANVLRGTGLAGLAGIPRARQLTAAATLIRPLLDVTRAEVVDYLRQANQPFREDSSNASLDYTRNRIRHELLPLLQNTYNPQVREALLRLSRLAGEADDEITGLAAEFAAQFVQPIPGGIAIPVDRLMAMSPIIARSVLRAAWRSQGWPEQEMWLTEWELLLAIAHDVTAPARTFPGAIRAQTSSGMVQLTRA
jgi:tRNA(Ile)-lysidine synthase